MGVKVERSVFQWATLALTIVTDITIDDDEFFLAVDDDYVVGLLADSFGLGVVP